MIAATVTSSGSTSKSGNVSTPTKSFVAVTSLTGVTGSKMAPTWKRKMTGGRSSWQNVKTMTSTGVLGDTVEAPGWLVECLAGLQHFGGLVVDGPLLLAFHHIPERRSRVTVRFTRLSCLQRHLESGCFCLLAINLLHSNITGRGGVDSQLAGLIPRSRGCDTHPLRFSSSVCSQHAVDHVSRGNGTMSGFNNSPTDDRSRVIEPTLSPALLEDQQE